MLIVMLIYFLGTDFVDSMLQLRKAAHLMDFRLFLSGCILFFLTALACITSFVYNLALAHSDPELIVNAKFLLFINEMDEQFLNLLDSLAPGWMGKRYLEIKEVMIQKSHSNPESSNSHRRAGVVRMEKFRFVGEGNNFIIEPSVAKESGDDIE